jgi:type IX secretion system PorP/SprF family membrane protein
MKSFKLTLFLVLLTYYGQSQVEPHYTMFMYNKLLYNPAYAGNKDVYTFNARHRRQWTGINGAPKTITFSIDAPLKPPPINRIGLGLSINNEEIGVVNSTDMKFYYSFRIFFEKTTLSLGLSGGGKFYSTNFSRLNPYQPNDPNTYRDFNNKFLPNSGMGIFLKDANDEKYYIGFSVPNIIQNYYSKNTTAKEIRGYYLSAGYIFALKNENIKLLPQTMLRYIRGGTYQLPLSCDFNLSAIVHDLLLLGASYRTDGSISGIIQLQLLRNINIGYASDFLFSDLSPYDKWTHEILIGYDIPIGKPKYLSPHFIKSF